MNKDRVVGVAKTGAGKVQIAAGKAMKKPGMQIKGAIKVVEGRAQATVGKLKDVAAKALKA